MRASLVSFRATSYPEGEGVFLVEIFFRAPAPTSVLAYTSFVSSRRWLHSPQAELPFAPIKRRYDGYKKYAGRITEGVAVFTGTAFPFAFPFVFLCVAQGFTGTAFPFAFLCVAQGVAA